MKELSEQVRDCLCNGDFIEFGKSLHQGWLYKRELASGISNTTIDELYENALKAGAMGGKILGAGGGGFLLVFCKTKHQNKVKKVLSELPILGAGGGGFLLVFCKTKHQNKVKKVLSELPQVPVKLEPQGSKIIYVEDIYRQV
jgi:galactokinase/mevalonate kinase-like predicted kinase